MRFKEVFKRLNGREAVAEDVLKFERLTTALETTPGDAMLAVLVALDHYETLYGTIPAKIAATATDTLSRFKQSADAQAAASIAAAQASLSKAVADVATKVAEDTAAAERSKAEAQKLKWYIIYVATTFILCIGAAWWTHSLGYKNGYSDCKSAIYSEARDEKIAAAWGNTAQGKAAYKLAKVANIENIINCDNPGWSIKNKVCIVQTAADGIIYGWRIK